MRSHCVRATLVAILCAPAALAAQDHGAFIVRLGNDTVAVERYTRSAGQLEGDLLARSPRTRWFHYTATLRPDGSVGRFAAELRPIPGAPAAPSVRMTLDFGNDSVISVTTVGDSSKTQQVVVGPVALPMFPNSTVLTELALRVMLTRHADSLAVDQVYPGGAFKSRTVFRRLGHDSTSYDYFGSPVYVRVDQAGRALAVDAGRTTVKVQVERVPNAGIEALAIAFAARDVAGQGLGAISGRDTTRGAVGSAAVWVDYGRPLVRGRVIFGGLVPWGEVWRTGANAATQLSTDKDLVIGGASVPAGKYTLWTLPTKEGATLVINSQTGQWGTEYDAKRDFARVPLTVSALAAPVERFTISIVPAASGGMLTMDWDRTRFTVPMQLK
ncbi:MAG: DUF2911 domain-containing protein [Gemmatimonadales bacterium]